MKKTVNCKLMNNVYIYIYQVHDVVTLIPMDPYIISNISMLIIISLSFHTYQNFINMFLNWNLTMTLLAIPYRKQTVRILPVCSL